MSIAIDRDADFRARLQQHQEASECGDLGAEHAIYAADAILGGGDLAPPGRAGLAEPIPAREQPT